MGVALAFGYNEVKNRKIDLKESKLFAFAWHFNKFLVILLINASFIIQRLPFEQRFVFAIVAGLNKVGWGATIAILVFGMQLGGYGGFWRALANAHGWRRLSKLNYAVLLIHVFCFQLLVGPAITLGPLQVSYGLIATLIVALVGVSYALAVIVHMLVELPASNLCSNRKERVRSSSKV